MSRAKQWRILTGQEEVKYNEHMARGDELESYAVKLFQDKYGVPLVKTGDEQQFIHSKYFGATPDGLTGRGNPFEAKCPTVVKDNYSTADLLQYAAQPYIQIDCTKTEYGFLMLYSPEKERTFRVGWSDELWNWLEPKLMDFWACVKENKEPEAFKRGVKGQLLKDLEEICAREQVFTLVKA